MLALPPRPFETILPPAVSVLQLSAVLDHAEDVASLDLDGVPPTSHPLPLVNVLRADVVVEGVDREEVLSQAPSVEDRRFRVPAILGEEP